jgi:hypothetical protein
MSENGFNVQQALGVRDQHMRHNEGQWFFAPCGFLSLRLSFTPIRPRTPRLQLAQQPFMAATFQHFAK